MGSSALVCEKEGTFLRSLKGSSLPTILLLRAAGWRGYSSLFPLHLGLGHTREEAAQSSLSWCLPAVPGIQCSGEHWGSPGHGGSGQEDLLILGLFQVLVPFVEPWEFMAYPPTMPASWSVFQGKQAPV